VAALGSRPCPCQSALELAIWSDRSTIPAQTRDRLRPILGKYLDPKA
jgi:5'-methylthioadenosine phosphorylase